MLSILLLLDEPNPFDPIVPEIAATAFSDPATYEYNARLYTQRYANGSQPTQSDVDNALVMLRQGRGEAES